MNPTIHLIETKELDARSGDGLEVRLLWQAGTDVLVEILDARRDERVVFRVAAHRALDAFRHPFAYAARAGEPHDACELAAITF
jgi:hypothetical protein